MTRRRVVVLDVPLVMRIGRAARELGVSVWTVRRMVKRGELQAIRRNGQRCFSRDEIIGWMARQPGWEPPRSDPKPKATPRPKGTVSVLQAALGRR